MSFGSRLKHAVLPAFCFKPSPTLDDSPAPSSRHRLPGSPPDLQPRGPQPDKPSRRRSSRWFCLRSSRHHAPQAELPGTAPRQVPDTGPASPPAGRPGAPSPCSVNTWAALDRLASEAGQPPGCQASVNVWAVLDRLAAETKSTPAPPTGPATAKAAPQIQPGAPTLGTAAPQDPGPRFDASRSSSLRMEVSKPDVAAQSARTLPPPAPWLPLFEPEPGLHDALTSFDRRSHDSRDPTVRGSLDRSMWRDLTLQLWAGAGAGELTPVDEVPAEARRSLGAEVLRLGGVLAGHTARQVVATGTSTLAREAVNIGITMGLRHRPGLAAGLTVSMTLLNLLAQLQREKRVLRAPDEAARGFHSLSQGQWQAASPQQRETLRQEQQASSRRVTKLHLVSNLITSAIALAGAARPGGRIGAMAAPLPSMLLGQMAKQWVYVSMRDSLQATFSLVQPRQPSPLPNIEQQRLRTAGATYGGVQTLLSYAQEAAMPRVLSALSRGSETIRASGGLLSSVGSGLGQWARAIAAVAGVRAGFNAVGEIFDDVQLTHHDAAHAGGEQVLHPDVRGLDPARRDYGRLLDHAMVRLFANDVAGGVMNVVGLAAGQLPAGFGDVASFIGNFGLGCLVHLTYPTVGNNFAAAGLVRDAMRPLPPMDLEASMNHPFTPSVVSQASRTSSFYRPEA